MEALRLGGLVDELGRGKNLIFAEFLRSGKKPPEVVLEHGGRFDRWRLYLYTSAQDRQQLRVFERLKEKYHDEQKALIANALVLWRGHPVSRIQQFVDGESSHTFAEVLSDLDGPIFYDQKKDEIVLRRWVRILLGEGKDSKRLSPDEEEDLLESASKSHMTQHRGYITPKQLRGHAGMGDTPSEVVLTSEILKRWISQGKIKKVKKGVYQFVNKPSEDRREALRKALAIFLQESGRSDRGPATGAS
jgi:hypothetical protein